jgi:hypothetical protein
MQSVAQTIYLRMTEWLKYFKLEIILEEDTVLAFAWKGRIKQRKFSVIIARLSTEYWTG